MAPLVLITTHRLLPDVAQLAMQRNAAAGAVTVVQPRAVAGFSRSAR